MYNIKINTILSLMLLFNMSSFANPLILIHPEPPVSSVPKVISSLVFYNESKIITAGRWNEFFVWDINSGAMDYEKSTEIKYSGRMEISPDDNFLALANVLGKLSIFNLNTQETLYVKDLIVEPPSIVRLLAFSPESKYLVSAFEEEGQIWSLINGEMLMSFEKNKGELISFFDDEHLIFFKKGVIEITNIFSGEVKSGFSILEDSPIYKGRYKNQIFFLKDNEQDVCIIAYDLNTGNRIGQISNIDLNNLIATSNDMKIGLFTNNDQLEIKNMFTKDILLTLTIPKFNGDVRKGVFSDDLTKLAIDIDADVYLYDISEINEKSNIKNMNYNFK